MSDINREIANLSSERLELLKALLKKEGVDVSTALLIPLPRGDGANYFPMSFAQQRLWFLDQLEPGNPIYNQPYALSLKGSLDVAALEKVFGEIIRRHESLRTTFSIMDGQPVQVVSPPQPFALPVTDLSGTPTAERRAEALRLVNEEGRRPFDLARGPLVRASVLRLGEEEHWLAMTMHHIVFDGWSIGVLVEEVGVLYAAYAAGRPSPLGELPAQYADYAAWQRERLRGEALGEQLGYWKRQLGGEVPRLELPTDRPRPPVQTFRGATQSFTLPHEAVESLKALSTSEGTTLYMTMLAAFDVLLHRYTGQDDIVVASPIAGRNHKKIERLIGFLVNTLVLRTDMAGDPTFRELLSRVREVTLGAYAHQEVPFEKLVEELQPERSLSHTPLFQVMFALLNSQKRMLKLPGITLDLLDVNSGTAKFDLTLYLTEATDELSGQFEYNADLFDRATVGRMVGHFVTLLESIAANPDRRVSALPLMGPNERYRLLKEWNSTGAAYPHDLCLHELFEAQAERTPDAVALVFDGQQLTYRELNERANRLARHLRRRGLKPETRVGLYVERSLEMVTGLLGILKAGAAYVPLDPAYPARRLGYMMEDARLPIVLTQERLLETLPEHDAEVICLDSGWETIARESETDAGTAVSPDGLAYVIYTSGSTGRPKGVQIAHGALVNLLWSMRERPGLTGEDVLLSVTTLSFDIAALEIFLPLIVGARLVVVSREVASDGKELLARLDASGATVMQATPATWRLMLEAGWGEADTKSLKILCGGESLPKELADQLSERCASLWNMYGPTETTIWSALHQVDDRLNPVPIGRPINNTDLYILDAHMRPVPTGIVGQLFIGGAGLSRGYLNRPGMTAERFVPHPFSPEPGARLYATGDRARHLPDGLLQMLGRADSQVKVRGHRIELGEIEATLEQHTQVRECAVVLRADGGAGDGRIVAYVAAEGVESGEPTWEHEQVQRWRAVWDQTYNTQAEPRESQESVRAAELTVGEPPDPTLDLRGWDSVYTGRPIPEPEMREWVERTAERVVGCGPRRVLEVGCGSGLLLWRVAPRCEAYWGTDISPSVVAQLRRQLQNGNVAPEGAALDVRVLERAADDFSGLAEQRFDAVVLNSVAQYFPSLEYLGRVIRSAVETVAGRGGTVFIGDVRSLPLLETLHASVEVRRAASGERCERVAERTRDAVARQQELVIDPAYFYALQEQLPQIRRVRVLHKRGRFENELNKFRYDVVLEVGGDREDDGETRRVSAACEVLAWEPTMTVERMCQLAEQSERRCVRISGVRNARLVEEVELAVALFGDARPETLAELQERLSRRRNGDDAGDAFAVDPEQVYERAAAAGYEVDVLWSGGGAEDRFDVELRKGGLKAWQVAAPRVSDGRRAEGSEGHAAKRYANDPLRMRGVEETGRRLRRHVAEHLPAYMVPSSVVVMERLPLTPNGKVDRRALALLDERAQGSARAHEAPRNELEDAVAQLWAEVLGAERVGVNDNFFDLGGHSLLAAQLISRLHKTFQVELPLRRLFEVPTVAGLAEQISLARRAGRSSPSEPIRVVPRDGHLHLSIAQQRLWMLEQLEQDNPAYNVPAAGRLNGRLDVAALEQSLGEITRRHEVLRTTFTVQEGQPRQLIAPPRPFELPLIDLSQLGEAEREAEARHLMSDEAERPFDLERGPLVRAALLRLEPEEHILALTMHHIISDGWSIGVLMWELGTLYKAYSAGRPSPLGELPAQYADYAAWQRERLRGEALGEQLSYWKRQLGGEVPRLELPTDRPRPPVQTFRGARHTVEFSVELTESLKAFSRREGASLYMTLLAGFEVLLHRYTGQEDIVVASPTAGRDRVEVESLIGFFVNTLVLRADLSGDPQFRVFLRRVRELIFEAHAHQEVPFEKLVEELQPERSLSHTPLFQVMFALMHTPRQTIELPGLRMNLLDTDSGTAKFDLSLFLFESAEGVSGFFEYNTDLFDAATIERMWGHFRTILEGVAARPDARLSELPVLTEAERRLLLREWNDTSADYARELCVHEAFEAQAERAPDEVALVYEDEQLTYGELNARANQLARHLRGLGVGAETLVGVHVRRSTEMVTGLLGVLKAGGAYIPLDPDHPKDRLALMLKDAGASVLLTQEELSDGLPNVGARVVCLDSERDVVSRQSVENVESVTSSSNLAYVIYTSGSTGKPKGVMVSHRNLVNFFEGMDGKLGVRPGEVVLALTGISFDISALELLWPLVKGNQVVLLSERAVGEALSPSVTRHQNRPMEFSLFYFASDEADGAEDKYRLLVEGAKFADSHGFTAVWTPERHFHRFGGLYPNPSVVSSALAMITERVQLRAGSVVLPLHSAIRVAEEWALVDNLSRGRIGLAFASGWHARDFAFFPERYQGRREEMFREIETVRRLWQGRPVKTVGGDGREVEVEIFPKPVQPQLPVWITCAGNPETFVRAGQIGANVLTHLLGQTVEEVGENVARYREARARHGHDPDAGHVTLMIHAFVGDDLASVKETVREPFTGYLKSSVDLSAQLVKNLGFDIDEELIRKGDTDSLLPYAFERYFQTSALFGTPDTCLPLIDRLKGASVDEVACLIDFGVGVDTVVESLGKLAELKEKSNTPEETKSYGLHEQIADRRVSLMQCTPSMMGLLATSPETMRVMKSLGTLLLGGEALPESLARQVAEALPARLFNMYGPTETTIWSAVASITPEVKPVPIGRPIANTDLYVLDSHLNPLPAGIVGELYIGGDGLARGYLNRPGMTAERFVPHPFSPEPGARLYATGDRARHLPDGQLQALGRADSQVKVRGHRVELGEIEVTLERHPAVRESAVVLSAERETEDPRLVAYVVPDWQAVPDAGLEHEQVQRWQEIWEQTYDGHDDRRRSGRAEEARGSRSEPDPTLDLRGWDSLYTRRPIPEPEMREWVERTAERIAGRGPRRVLEVGCGSGLLLWRVAPRCEAYWGTDISPSSVRELGERVERARAEGLLTGDVRVLERAADDFSGFDGEHFDTVVINSVAQYFPSLEYLQRVVEGAVNLVAPVGGFVFVGDVRSLPLLETLHASVQLERAANGEDLRRVAEQAREQARREQELAVDPEYFLRLKKRLKHLGEVRVLHKRGRYQNELTRYRYDVVLEVKRAAEKTGGTEDGASEAPSAECRVIPWEPSLTAEAMCDLLREGEAQCVRVAGVKNARLAWELKAARMLSEADRAGKVKELRELLRAEREDEHAVDPEDVYESILSAGHEVEVSWSGTGREDSFDVLMWRRGVRAPEGEDWAGREETAEGKEGEEERRYANDPLRALSGGKLAQRLRRYVGEQLPSYMVPSSIVLLESMPLTPNKKIDRRALSALEKAEGVEERVYEPPRNEVEEVVAGIWAEVLGVERVGIHDNFFELGGHSLLAIQIAMRMQNMGFAMKSQQLFRYHTVAELAEILVLPGRQPSPPEGEQAALLSAALETAAAPTAAPAGAAVEVEESELPADVELEFYDPRRVFLTGATGYLGAYLLKELLQQTDAEVYCLVRAAGREDGDKRLREQFAWYFPDSARDEAWSRVVPVPGDLRSARLGLSTEDYRLLCDTMDAVYHSAADVRHIGDEDNFDAVNVNGTRLMVELSRTGRRKVLHHISTVYVGGLQGDSEHTVFREQDFDIRQELEAYPYLQSKFLAERVVREAMAEGCDAVIHRTGNITADSRTGRFQRNIQENIFYRTMRAVTMMGVAPYAPGVPIEVTPVDFIARGVVNLSRVRNLEGQTFHYINPRQLELYDLIRTLQAIGYPIRLANADEFLKMIWASGGSSEYAADLIHFIGFFGGGNIKPLEVDGSYTRGWLRRLGIECSPPSSAWLNLMVQHCVEVKYLPPPSGGSAAGTIPELLRG